MMAILTDYVYDANEFLMTHGDHQYFVIFKTLKFNPWQISVPIMSIIPSNVNNL